MSDCRRTTDRLTSYVDAALPPAERADVEQHLHACPPCRVRAEQEQGGRTVLRQRAGELRSAPLPPGLRTRCAALARAAQPAPPRSWGARLVPAGISAALILFTVFAVFTLATQRSNTLLAAQLSADHDRCFREVPLPAAELGAAAEETRLADEYGWDIHVPPSSPRDGVKLVGARRCLFTHGGVPHLLYDAGGRELSLYVFEGVTRPEGEITALGHRSRIWTRGATTFVLVSPESAGALTQAVAYVQREAH
jgi:anti-sigma factor RsiW